MLDTDFIEDAVLQEIQKYEYGTFTDREIVAMEVEAVEICLFRFDPVKTTHQAETIVTQKYNEIYK